MEFCLRGIGGGGQECRCRCAEVGSASLSSSGVRSSLNNDMQHYYEKLEMLQQEASFYERLAQGCASSELRDRSIAHASFLHEKIDIMIHELTELERNFIDADYAFALSIESGSDNHVSMEGAPKFYDETGCDADYAFALSLEGDDINLASMENIPTCDDEAGWVLPKYVVRPNHDVRVVLPIKVFNKIIQNHLFLL